MLKKIAVADLRLGMFIHEFCGSWMEHPFWKAKFVLETQKDLQRVRGSAVSEVWIDTSKGLDIEAEVVEGFSFDKGWASPFFVTDTGRQEAVYEKPAILITDKKISSVQEFLPMLEKLAQSGKKDVVLIADEVEGEALSTLVVNAIRKTLKAVAVKAPFFGDRRKAFLEDLAVVTGGQVVNPDVGLTLREAGLDVLGTARRVVVRDRKSVV